MTIANKLDIPTDTAFRCFGAKPVVVQTRSFRASCQVFIIAILERLKSLQLFRLAEAARRWIQSN